MSILKIKNEQGEWVELPVIKGTDGKDGIDGKSGVYVGTEAPTDEDIDVWIDSDGTADDIVTDVQINGQSIVADGVANVPIASANSLGLIKVGDGLSISGSTLKTFPSDAILNRFGANNNRPITPFVQHSSTFYGLAKAAGDTTQSQSSNAVGNYTEDAKSKIKKMIGVNDEFELIRCITLEEDSQTVIIDTDESSSPFSLQGFMIAIVSLAATGATAEGYLKIALSTSHSTNRIADVYAGIRKNTNYKNIAIMGTALKGIGHQIVIAQQDGGDYIVDSNGVINRSLYNTGSNLYASFSNQQNVHSVFVGTDNASSKLGAGSIIALYGIRA